MNAPTRSPARGDRHLSLLAVGLATLEVATAAYAFYLIWHNYGLGLAVWELAWLGAAPVGGMTAALRPRHPVGWLLLAIGASGSLSQFAYTYNPGRHPSVPAALLANSGTPLLELAVVLIAVLMVVFPGGRLDLMRRHLRLGALAAFAIIVSMLATLTSPTISSDLGNPPNPLALPRVGPLSAAAMVGVSNAATAVAVGFVLLVAANLALRCRRAQGVQRQQLKWLAFTSLTMGPAVAVSSTTSAWWTPLALIVSANAICLSVGLAIVRYHLFDVDRVISRTVAYLLVLSALAGVYTGSVLLFSDVLPLRGSLGVALAALVAVALLAPLQRRVRDLVDRRFDRARYDAQAVVRAFSSRMSEEMDRGRVSQDLLVAVQRTVAPAHAGLWLPSAPRGRV
ncbi:MAG: hypothetical protein ACREN4_07090 [Candidatus Dormibacteria bacterium]